MESRNKKPVDEGIRDKAERLNHISAIAPHAARFSGPLIISSLSQMTPRTLLDEAALAGVFNVSERTIRRMVERYQLPPPIPVAGRSMWMSGRVLDFLDAAAQREEEEARRQAEKIRKLSS